MRYIVEISLNNSSVAWVPLLAFSVLSLTIVVTYTWAVALDYVDAVFPYISTAGARPPVSCFFSLMLNVEAILLGTLVCIRHHQIIAFYKMSGNRGRTLQSIVQHSYLSACTGIAAAIGLSFVGSFQSINVPLWHYVGAGLAFGIGTVYMGYQSWLSYILGEKLAPQRFSMIRMMCTLTSVLAIITMAATNITYNMINFGQIHQGPGVHIDGDPSEVTEWYGLRVSSAVCEWIVALCIDAYVLSFVPEFKKIQLKDVLFDFDFSQ